MSGRTAVFMLALLIAPTGWAATVGDAAPEFTAKDLDGTQRSLSDYAGRYVVLEWFNPDCPFVRKHYDSGNMQQLQAAYTERDVTWIIIDSSAPGKQGYLTPTQAKRVLRERRAFPTAMFLDPDGAIGRLYGAKTTPHMFIIDPQGTLVYAGGIDDTPSADPADIPASTNYVAQALDQALAGEVITMPSSRSYGCSVKY